ncbi:MAG TPA: nucleotidyltransferase domain-containing protein [Leadbetterella sp.]|jgi:predicted nucleotidyltransferase|nr:nucleotidyltransferase domain-containing protein [Leadbetterella sp.]
MLSTESQKIIESYFSRQPVKKAYIFGSFARNEESEKSDVDILVDLDYQNGADFFKFLDMKEQLSLLLKKSVDLVSSNGLSRHIKPVIEKEMKLIYSKSNDR